MCETTPYLFPLFSSVAVETVAQLHPIFTNTVCRQIISRFIFQSVKRTSCSPQGRSQSRAPGSFGTCCFIITQLLIVPVCWEPISVSCKRGSLSNFVFGSFHFSSSVETDLMLSFWHGPCNRQTLMAVEHEEEKTPRWVNRFLCAPQRTANII